METGNCSQSSTKWFYDKEARFCREFVFTGCRGNANKFETRQQCGEVCEEPKRREICHAKKFPGPCVDFEPRWYHDPATRSCRQFDYGGCLANENNFGSMAACVHFCWSFLSDESRELVAVAETSTQAAGDVDVCRLGKREGVACGERGGERWFFDQAIRACRKFVFKGCAGNGNNFETLAGCEEKCSENAHLLDISRLRSKNSGAGCRGSGIAYPQK